jgi:hypothetical protein
MNAHLSYLHNRSSTFDPPPVVVAATSDEARAHAIEIVEASGLRLAAAISIDEAPDRLLAQASATAVWCQLDRNTGTQLERTLEVLNHDVALQRYVAVVSAPGELIDFLFARLSDDIQLLIDANDAECVAALAVAATRRQDKFRLSDISADRDAARLRQLSAEVNRIASTLARLSNVMPSNEARPKTIVGNEIPQISPEAVRKVIRARRLRTKFFREDLFADPAWDMLLDLFQSELSGLRTQVSSACIAAAVPATTALRWLTAMVREGIFVRHADPHDGRRVFVELAPETSTALRTYFAELDSVSVI